MIQFRQRCHESVRWCQCSFFGSFINKTVLSYCCHVALSASTTIRGGLMLWNAVFTRIHRHIDLHVSNLKVVAGICYLDECPRCLCLRTW